MQRRKLRCGCRAKKLFPYDDASVCNDKGSSRFLFVRENYLINRGEVFLPVEYYVKWVVIGEKVTVHRRTIRMRRTGKFTCHYAIRRPRLEAYRSRNRSGCPVHGHWNLSMKLCRLTNERRNGFGSVTNLKESCRVKRLLDQVRGSQEWKYLPEIICWALSSYMKSSWRRTRPTCTLIQFRHWTGIFFSPDGVRKELTCIRELTLWLCDVVGISIRRVTRLRNAWSFARCAWA